MTGSILGKGGLKGFSSATILSEDIRNSKAGIYWFAGTGMGVAYVHYIGAHSAISTANASNQREFFL